MSYLKIHTGGIVTRQYPGNDYLTTTGKITEDDIETFKKNVRGNEVFTAVKVTCIFELGDS